MSRIKDWANVFSKRNTDQLDKLTPIPPAFRNKVLRWATETFPFETMGWSGSTFWREAERRMFYRNGVGIGNHYDSLTPGSFENAVKNHLFKLRDENFLDFIEDIFIIPVDPGCRINKNYYDMVGEMNDLFAYDSLPYYVTDYVFDKVQTVDPRTARFEPRILNYPKVIFKKSETLHELAIKPALELLKNPIFQNANTEFLGALEDYRKGRYQESLDKCNSAFESVIKIISDNKKWKYDPCNPASKLIKDLIPNMNLDGCFESILITVATVRNKYGSAHGAGTTPRLPSAHIAQYAINVTASNIMLVANEAGYQ